MDKVDTKQDTPPPRHTKTHLKDTQKTPKVKAGHAEPQGGPVRGGKVEGLLPVGGG
jgi:hypothetical protein